MIWSFIYYSQAARYTYLSPKLTWLSFVWWHPKLPPELFWKKSCIFIWEMITKVRNAYTHVVGHPKWCLVVNYSHELLQYTVWRQKYQATPIFLMLTHGFLFNNIGILKFLEKPENTDVCKRIVLHEFVLFETRLKCHHVEYLLKWVIVILLQW